MEWEVGEDLAAGQSGAVYSRQYLAGVVQGWGQADHSTQVTLYSFLCLCRGVCKKEATVDCWLNHSKIINLPSAPRPQRPGCFPFLCGLCDVGKIPYGFF